MVLFAGEALDAAGGHVRAHQVSVWVAKAPAAEKGAHSNILVDNLVSMNSRADGLNVHGAVKVCGGPGLPQQHTRCTARSVLARSSLQQPFMCVGDFPSRSLAINSRISLRWCVQTDGANGK